VTILFSIESAEHCFFTMKDVYLLKQHDSMSGWSGCVCRINL